MNIEKELESGWTFDSALGATCHFEHVSTEFADQQTQDKNEIYIVEAINWTFADEQQKVVHFNKYFAYGINEALALAVRLQFSSLETAEEFLRIRIATQEERDTFLKVAENYNSQMPKAISDDEAKLLS